MRIPLLNRGHANRASSADSFPRSRSFLHFRTTPKFRNPLPHPARVAVLSQKFSGNNLKIFDPSDSEAIQSFRPGILAGTLSALRNLKNPIVVSKAIVVFSAKPISEEDRDCLWRQFAVPCFEQILNTAGHVIAEECQVHAGLHVLNLEAIHGTLTSEECDCGRTEPRLGAPTLR